MINFLKKFIIKMLFMLEIICEGVYSENKWEQIKCKGQLQNRIQNQ